MESESKHFSHEHELTLHEVQQLDDGETERAACYACLEQIAEQAFFTCGDCDDFFLHQTCANLSKEIEGPVHPQHPLILLANRSCYCDVCGRDWKRFTYNCAPCDFDVCIACAWVGKIKNLGHDHPLVPYNQVKENDTGGEEVVCGGCNKPITEDDAYSCSDCDFFLHKTCAELPEVINHVSHPMHPLSLFKEPPYRDSFIPCDCCRETWGWFTYNCKLCNYDICISCSLVTELSALGKIKHSSHNHPLIVEAFNFDDKEVICYGCRIPITGLAFSCRECNIFLHKTCDLPYQVEYFSHPEHPLTLLFRQDQAIGQLLCSCCGDIWVRFIYYCELCKFKICLPCALLSFDRPPRIEKQILHDHTLHLFSRPPDSYSDCSCSCCGERPELLLYRCELCDFHLCMSCASCDSLITTHGGHDHPLTITRRALFRCDACGVEDKDLSYTCTTCKFWVHKNCASLESTFQSGHHTQHALTLAFSLPQQFLKYKPRCEICAKRLRTDRWLYLCAVCRFFAHVQCATSDLKSTSSEQNEIKVGESDEVMKFPVPDEFMNQINYFLQVLNIVEIQRATEITHVSHPHPLILCDVQAGNICIAKNDLLVCNGCTQLIVASNSYYGCSQVSCDFFLHTICTELPDEVQHPCHPQHPLSFHPKSSAESLSIFLCDLCNRRCNGFRYRCELCNFDLDLRCASVPDTIVHEAHRHPLVPATSGIHCSACKEYCDLVTYGCDTCGFYLEAFCAMYPRTATHYYDAHTLSLVYPPFPDHPDEFYCEMCQDEIAPNLWLYHCHDCNQSFHPRCLLPGHWCSNIKSGGTCVVAKNIHEHPKLKLQKILQGERLSKWKCGLCGEGKPAMVACTECDFLMCLRCLMNDYPSADVHW